MTRQTALLARQVADADLLSRERVRLGVGTGWNDVEYDVLGRDLATRGAQLDEQIELLRRQIPIWIGGFAEPAYRRGGRRCGSHPAPVWVGV